MSPQGGLVASPMSVGGKTADWPPRDICGGVVPSLDLIIEAPAAYRGSAVVYFTRPRAKWDEAVATLPWVRSSRMRKRS